MKHYSVVEKEKFNSLKEDIKGSLTSAIDKLFESAHMISVNTSGNSTYLTAEYVVDGSKKTSVIWFDSLMFKE